MKVFINENINGIMINLLKNMIQYISFIYDAPDKNCAKPSGVDAIFRNHGKMNLDNGPDSIIADLNKRVLTYKLQFQLT